ncbi:MAG: hypothetical protein AB1476_06620, partial [Candidatus Hadarchaeota archaeon]
SSTGQKIVCVASAAQVLFGRARQFKREMMIRAHSNQEFRGEPGINMMVWGVETMWEGAVMMAEGAISLAAEVVVDVVGDAIASAKEAQHYEAEYNWAWEMNYDRDGPEGPDGDYGWEDSGWEWEGPEGDDGGGMDGADFGC